MDWKSYATQSNAIAAIKKAGLQNVPHHFEVVGNGNIRPVFTPELAEDAEEIRSRGFFARTPRTPRA